MRIVVYRAYNDYFTHDFDAKELDDILQVCHNEGIKWYVLVY